MSRLDEELNEALEVSESGTDGAAPPGVAVEVAETDTEPPKRNVALLGGLLVMGAAILGLVLSNAGDTAIYSKTVPELLEESARLSGRTVRVTGTLVSGSLARRQEPCEYRFQLQKDGKTVPVRYAQCVVPDTFRDVPGIPVEGTAEGKLAEGGHFEASHIMAKCPSKYEMKERAANGEEIPHGEVLDPASAPSVATPPP